MNTTTGFLVGTLFGAAAVTAAFAIAKAGTDPVKQSPQYYTVHIDNDRVRVLEYRLKPGEKEPVHSHPAGVVFTLTDSRMRRTEFPPGKPVEEDTHAGTVSWHDPVTHSSENIGTSVFHAYRVELKDCKSR
jgi:beta-alanine degradation protein BauB